MIVVTVNGKEQRLEAPIDLLAYLKSRGIKMKNVAVAHNGTVLRQDELASITLSNGDWIEVVRAVGGG